MENLYILYSETLDYSDPHGYMGSFARKQANFQCYIKRSFLNECINRIYILSENYAPMMVADYNKQRILNELNCIVAPPMMSIHEAKVERVKRRLFYESRKQPRKLQKPKRNKIIFCEFLYFKVERHMWGIQKIRRNFLDCARLFIHEQLRQARKRKYDEIEAESDNVLNPIHSTNGQGAFEVSQPAIGTTSQVKPERAIKVRRRVNTREEIMKYEEQYSQRSLTNDMVLEASIRSLLYLRVLMQNMIGQPDDDDVDRI